MRLSLSLVLGLVAALPAMAGGKPVWPDADIPVPPKVHAYIVAECVDYQSISEETLSECVAGEAYGYRAVVTMLKDPVTGDQSAERYRACRAGLGDYGGRFHRRRAECMGYALGFAWKFEFMERAAAETQTSVARANLPDGAANR